MFGLIKATHFYTIPLIVFSWLAVTYIIYRRKIVAHF
jgi:hypothetical protein